MKSKKIYIAVLCLMLIAGVLMALGSIIYQKSQYSKKTSNTKTKQTEQKSSSNFPIEEIEPYNNQLPNFRNQYNNPYIMGKLEIPNLSIDALVTRYSNNTYYLNNNILNQEDGIGVPFFDYRNTDLVNNRQINIYGHNTTNEAIINQLPFTKLKTYLNEEIYNNSKDVYLSIDEKQIKYRVIAVKIIAASNNEHMKLLFKNDEDFLQHTQKLLENTTYKDSEKITKKDKILVMQVCNYDPPDTYLLIICKAKNN